MKMNIIIFLACLYEIHAQTFLTTFLEIGFVVVPTDQFVTISTDTRTFIKPHVIMGMPHNGNNNLYSGYHIIAEVR